MLVTPLAVSMSSSIDTGRGGLAVTQIKLSDLIYKSLWKRSLLILLDPFHVDSTKGQKTVSSEDSSLFLPFLSQLVDDTGLEYYRRQRREPQLIFWAQSVNCFQVLSSSFKKPNQKKPHIQTPTSLELLNSILASFSIL